MEASEKWHDATDVTIRNQQASIKNIEAQLGQLTTLVYKWLPPKNLDPKPQCHVLAIFTEDKEKTAPLEMHDTNTEHIGLHMEGEKIIEK